MLEEEIMYSRSVDVCNKFVQDDSSPLRCKHGQPWENCTSENCPEIWQLHQQALDEERREENARVYAQKALKKRGKTKSEFEIALEQSPVSNCEDYEFKITEDKFENESGPGDRRKLFRNIFADEITFRAALQFRVLTLRQACLVKAYLDSDDELPNHKRWAAIGRRIGRSGKTVEREFLNLVKKFLKTNANNDGRGATIEAVHVRGERQLRYYRKHSVRIGEWRRDWSELIIDKKIIRELRRKGAPMIRSEKTPIPSSPVNRLFGALIKHFASDLPAGDVRPYDVTVHDWEYNLRKAERLLKRKSPGPWTALEVYYALGRGARLCRACRTFLIRGFRINGGRITRAKEFCDDSCKMRAARRKIEKTSPGSL
jgi:hypothetical protein